MHRYLAVAAAVLIAGCASTSDTTSTAQQPAEEKEYRVGSRIPVRNPVGASPTTTVDPSAMRSGSAPTRTN
jgi:heat shock protein HslJ